MATLALAAVCCLAWPWSTSSAIVLVLAAGFQTSTATAYSAIINAIVDLVPTHVRLVFAGESVTDSVVKWGAERPYMKGVASCLLIAYLQAGSVACCPSGPLNDVRIGECEPMTASSKTID